MRKFYLIAVLGVFLALAIYAITYREPTYQGKALTAWLQDVDPAHSGPARDKAEEAVQHIGADAVPVLIHLLRQRDYSIRARISQWVRYHHLLKGEYVPTYLGHRHAALACYVLGSKALPAIPALTELLNDPNSQFDPNEQMAQSEIAFALGQIGPESIPPLIQSLSNTNASTRTWILFALGDFKSNAAAVVPVLLQSMHDPSPYCRKFAGISLGEIAQNAELCVPALTNLLTESDADSRLCACRALSEFKERAQPAIPALLPMLEDGDAQIRGSAAIALVKIDPENVPRRQILMPILIKNLEGIGDGFRDRDYRLLTVEIIAQCGEQAKAAVPALVKCLADKEEYIRETAGKALKQIDPAAAAEAGVR